MNDLRYNKIKIILKIAQDDSSEPIGAKPVAKKLLPSDILKGGKNVKIWDRDSKDNGFIVSDIQKRLESLGYKMKYGSDGIFGDYTQGALKAFQKENDLPVTGEVSLRDYQLLTGGSAKRAPKEYAVDEVGSSTAGSVAIPAEGGKYIFPIKVRPANISNFGMRGGMKSLAAKYAPGGSSPNPKLYARYSKKHMHKGVDLSVPIGTDIFAPIAGVITTAKETPSSGLVMLLQGNDGFEHQFMHLSEFLVRPGDKITAGQLIARSGNSGPSTGPHLHYGCKAGGNLIDPMTLFS